MAMNIAELKEMAIPQLMSLAKELEVPNYSSMRKQELIFRLIQA